MTLINDDNKDTNNSDNDNELAHVLLFFHAYIMDALGIHSTCLCSVQYSQESGMDNRLDVITKDVLQGWF